MILSATLSRPAKNIEELAGKPYTRIKLRLSVSSSKENVWLCEMFTKTQVFHSKMNQTELDDYIEKSVPALFKNCVIKTDTSEITLLSNKKGKVSRLEKPLKNALPAAAETPQRSEELQQGRDGSALPERPKNSHLMELLKVQEHNRIKNYTIPEGKPVPFMVRLGIMTPEGKVIASKYKKFRQINRFLELFEKAVYDLPTRRGKGPVTVVDFGCGKSYLTFAVHYFLDQYWKRDCRIFGLDLKKDVIDYCNRIVEELDLKNISFKCGDIAEFTEEKAPDVVITLHACDKATDYALNYAVRHHATAILSVPCCQHEINGQLGSKISGTGFCPGDKTDSGAVTEPSLETQAINSLLKYGLIKERFSALVTDAVRGEALEKAGYNVKMIEFIEDDATPKNLMIQAVKREPKSFNWDQKFWGQTDTFGFTPDFELTLGPKKEPVIPLLNVLGVRQTLFDLLKKEDD